MGLYVNSDNLHTVEDVIDEVDGSTITTATVTACILPTEASNPASAALASSSITLTWDATQSRYEGTFPDTVALVAGTRYWIRTLIVIGSIQRDIRERVKATYK